MRLYNRIISLFSKRKPSQDAESRILEKEVAELNGRLRDVCDEVEKLKRENERLKGSKCVDNQDLTSALHIPEGYLVIKSEALLELLGLLRDFKLVSVFFLIIMKALHPDTPSKVMRQFIDDTPLNTKPNIQLNVNGGANVQGNLIQANNNNNVNIN